MAVSIVSACLLLAAAAALCRLCAASASAAAAEPPLPFVDEARAVLSKAMLCQGIRQLHAAAVLDGRTVLAYQLEVQPESGTVVDIQQARLLNLASVSKGMLGTALPRLQEGLNSLRREDGGAQVNLLKTPLRAILGEDFWFLDQTRTELVTIEDLVSHSTGLSRHDSMWYLGTVSSKEELARLTGQLQSAGSLGFRSSFRYNNLVWTIVDLALQRLTGKNYTDYMRQALWEPLNMTDTYGSTEMTEELWDRVHSESYAVVEGIPLESAALRNATNLVEAAGGVLVSLEDMIKYMHYLTKSNYSSVKPLPMWFGPVNAFAAENGLNYFHRDIYASPHPDFPDLEIESYSKGWFRTWYRNNLAYSHGGSLFGVRCELDVFLKRRMAVFTHNNLMVSSDAMMRPLYAAILNKYLADLLLMNASFVTRSNVCSLLHNLNTQVVALPRLNMSETDVAFCTGSFGSPGFGTVVTYWNRTSQAINAQYGILHVELVLVATKEQHYRFLPMPLVIANVSGTLVMGSNLSHILVLNTSLHSTAYVMIYNKSERVVLNYPALEHSMLLEKGLDPGAWRRPRLCEAPPPPQSKEGGVAGISVAGPVALGLLSVPLLLCWFL